MNNQTPLSIYMRSLSMEEQQQQPNTVDLSRSNSSSDVSLPRLIDAIAECASVFRIVEYNPLWEELSRLVDKHIELEGIISGGKTSLGHAITQCLRQRGKLRVVFSEERFLPDMLAYFYKEMDQVRNGKKEKNEAAFPMQLQMLMYRLNSYQKSARETGHVKIGDRGPVGDAVFASLQAAEGHITADQFQIYKKTLAEFEYAPDYLVFLDVTAEEAERRKNERARTEEDRVPRSYLHRLRLGYYLLLCSLAQRTTYRILLIRNNKLHAPEYILRRIINSPAPEQVRKIFSRAQKLDVDATESQLDAAFEEIHKKYDALESVSK